LHRVGRMSGGAAVPVTSLVTVIIHGSPVSLGGLA